MRLILLFAFVFIEFISIPFAQPVLQTPPSSINKWDICELTIQDNNIYNNPFWDVSILGKFTGPNSEKINVKGFYYEGNLWKVRMSPEAEGTWTFSLIYTTQSEVDTMQGSFQCTAPDPANHGFIQVNSSYPHKFKYSDNTVFIPHGTAGHTPAIVAAYLGIMPNSSADPGEVPAMWDSLSKYSVNTFRLMLFNQSGFEVPFSWNTDETTGNFFAQSGGLDMYNTFVGKAMDRWFEQAREHNIAIYLCMLTTFDITAYPFTSSPFSSANGGPYNNLNEMYQLTSGPGFDYQKKYYAYICSRYAAYRNIVTWEYNNEYGYYSSPSWLSAIDSVVRANDPYNRPRTVSFWSSDWSKQSSVDSQNSIAITDDHFYSSSFTTSNGDSAANEQARSRFSSYEKPVMFGEFGSGEGEETDYWFNFQRIAYWGAFTGGGYPLYWLSGNNDQTGWLYNQRTIEFIGSVNKVLNKFRNYNTMVPGVSETLSAPNTIRIFSLANNDEALYYIHNYTDNSAQTNGASVTVKFNNAGSQSYSGTWLDAATGDSAGFISGQLTNGESIISVPSFTTDILLYISLNTNTDVKAQKNIPNEFALFQNFPNPFNPSTTIKYSVSRASFVTLKVYSILGKEITTLVSGRKSSGTYSVTFNAGSLPSGVYFYKMQAGDFISAKKFIFMK